MEREREKEMDARDRAKEKEELEELRSKILAEGHDNPDAEFEKACAQREEQYKPKLLVKPAERKPQPPVASPAAISAVDGPPPPTAPLPAEPASAVPVQPPLPPLPHGGDRSDSDSDGAHSDAPPEPMMMDMEDNSQSRDAMSPMEPAQPQIKRKKLDIKEVFNQDDDDLPSKKKKLPLPSEKTSIHCSSDDTKEKGGKEKGGEEKRKHIKSLIDKIPTSKEELFAYPIDSTLVDNVLMEKRIRPWINKKIIEYIGEPEPTLVDFICSKVLVGSEPQSLLNDVQMVLDDEAEVFVVKMWRLLIYEIEAKKMGLGKS